MEANPFKAPESVLPNLTPPKPAFRDPKVFPYKGRWIMVLAVGDRIELYESANLKQWNLLSSAPLYSSFTTLGPFVETPDLIELPVSNSNTHETKWVLLYSEGFLPAWGLPGSSRQYRNAADCHCSPKRTVKDQETLRHVASISSANLMVSGSSRSHSLDL